MEKKLAFTQKINLFFCKIKKHHKIKTIIHYLTDTSTFKKTMLLSLFYVFLCYLPFTFMSLILNKAVFFQLDHLYQFSTIVFDFRNKIYNLDFQHGILKMV